MGAVSSEAAPAGSEQLSDASWQGLTLSWILSVGWCITEPTPMHCTLVLAFLAAFTATAADTYGLPPELLNLAKIKLRMRETLVRQPNYTCLEQIERSSRRAPKRRFELLDVMRLEVALVEGKELYAWPGSAKFEESDLSKLVPAGGAIGNGNFALFAHQVFASNIPVFTFQGEVELNGRRTLKYDYTVPQMQSGFHLKVSAREAVVGFHGSFWADLDNHDLLRLDVIADDLPPKLGLDQASTTMEYRRARIGERDFLLPASSELSMISLNGDENRNRIQFSGCRQYSGESVLSFGEAPASLEPEPVKVEKATLEVPVNLEFEATLDAALDTGDAMIGDPITATLNGPLKHKHNVLFPKGAKLLGRIVRMDRRGEYLVLDIRFSEIESDTGHSSLSASIQDVNLLSSSHLRRPPNARTPLAFLSSRVRLPKGLRFRLRTEAPATNSETVRN